MSFVGSWRVRFLLAKGLTVVPKGIRDGSTVKGQMDYRNILGPKAGQGTNDMHSILKLV